MCEHPLHFCQQFRKARDDFEVNGQLMGLQRNRIQLHVNVQIISKFSKILMKMCRGYCPYCQRWFQFQVLSFIIFTVWIGAGIYGDVYVVKAMKSYLAMKSS